jgi:hypothetical protein
VSQSSNKIIKKVAGETILSRKCKKPFFSDSPPFPSYGNFYVDVSFVILIVVFLQNGNSFNMTCQLTSFVAKEERKEILPSVEFFLRHFGVILFE